MRHGEKTRWRSLAWLGALCACALIDQVPHTRAATSSAPTISVARNTALNGSVWPVDLNGDGITDLVASGTFANTFPQDGVILAVIGKGDGTFGSPIKSSTTGEVLAVGDFNGDGKRDVLIRHAVSSTSVSAAILPGNGDGTFAAPITVGTFADITFARTADLNSDHVTDLIICDESTVYVYPGNGDFTFGTPASLQTGFLLLGGTIADFNGDGKPDIAVASHDGGFAVRIFLNQGALNFTVTDIALDRRANDVLAVDLNKDGHMDLIVATADSAADNPDAYVDGYAYVMLGHGDGTFADPAKYQTAAGAWRVVVGDFTRDGVVDIATANRSAIYRDDCTVSLKTWDSLSILPGNGDGTFGAASSFSLGDQSKLFDDRFRNTVLSLNTSDLNGDGATDLIASWGAIVKNNPADPNWAPKVTASSTQPAPGDAQITLTAPATDSDQDLLTYAWTDSGGTSIPPVPIACFSPAELGVHTFTVTVNDQHGHTASSSVTVDFGSGGGGGGPITITAPQTAETVAGGVPYTIRWTTTSEVSSDWMEFTYSTDNGSTWQTIDECANTVGSVGHCTWNNPGPDSTQAFLKICDANPDDGCDTSGPFTIQTTSGGSLPNGWHHADVGAVGAAGSASRGGEQDDGDQYTVTGSGADIWGTADAFHYAWTTFTGDFEITTRVSSLDAVDAWTKGGIMIRETATDPSSRQASIFVTPGKGVAYQRRLTTGGSSVNTSGPSLTAPLWLRMTRSGSLITAYYRKNPNDDWSPLGSDTMSGWPSTVAAGLAVTSHHDGVLATAQFAGTWSGAMPSWTNTTVGAATGSASGNGTDVTMVAQGADIWGTADAFEYRWVQLTGNAMITVRVGSVADSNAWAKAGLMVRESLGPGSKQVDAVVSAGKGVTMQYRAAGSGTSATAAIVAGTAPLWLRLQRSLNAQSSTDSFTAWYSPDGQVWHVLGSVSGVNMAAAAPVYVGLAVTSHNTGASTTALFDSVRLQ